MEKPTKKPETYWQHFTKGAKNKIILAAQLIACIGILLGAIHQPQYRNYLLGVDILLGWFPLGINIIGSYISWKRTL